MTDRYLDDIEAWAKGERPDALLFPAPTLLKLVTEVRRLRAVETAARALADRFKRTGQQPPTLMDRLKDSLEN